MNLKAKTILITGGCGLIGSTIADQLIAEDVAEIRVIDNLSRGTLLNIEQAQARGRVELIRKDIRSFADIRPHFEGVDVVRGRPRYILEREVPSNFERNRASAAGARTHAGPQAASSVDAKEGI